MCARRIKMKGMKTKKGEKNCPLCKVFASVLVGRNVMPETRVVNFYFPFPVRDRVTSAINLSLYVVPPDRTSPHFQD